MTLKERQKRFDAQPVWVPWAKWSDGTWGPLPEIGCGSKKNVAMALAANYMKIYNIKWLKGQPHKVRFQPSDSVQEVLLRRTVK